MLVQGLVAISDVPGLLALFVVEKLRAIFLSPSGTFSLTSLLSALFIGLAYLSHKHRHRLRPVRLAVLARAIFPRRLLQGRSTRADIGFFFLNSFVAGLLVGWAILSAHTVAKLVNGMLTSHVAVIAPTSLPDVVCGLIMTVAVFLAYELGYFTDHYLSHRVPFLWEFHKVHHTAEVLSPLTNFRVHPVDSVVFVNILAIVMGTTAGVLTWALGKPTTSIMLWGTNALLLIFTYLLDHLHHTEFWIPFRGVWGKIFISPAHHQIHHSADPAHFNRNMGSCLAIYDWLFGTLEIPSEQDAKLRFGVDGCEVDPHSVTGGLIDPFVQAAGTLMPTRRPVVAAVAPSNPGT